MFLKKAREHGAKVSNGLGMLMFQGIRSFEIWNSLDVSDDIADELLSGMREEVKKNTVKKGGKPKRKFSFIVNDPKKKHSGKNT
jgi:shikimate dehydrogenase